MNNSSYLVSVCKQFEYYQMLGTKTFEQLSEEQLFWQYEEESNSIAIIVRHLWGNMLSRWTGFLTSDGEKEWRNRDTEFDATIKSRTEVVDKWNAGWECLFDAIRPLEEKDLSQTIYIRNQGHTVVEAINRQLSHYAYHVGQIVFIGKMLRGKEGESLSIPKGASKTFNASHFAQEKHRVHFTDDFLKL